MWKFNCVQNGCPFRSNSSISLRNHSRCCHYISTSIIEEENIPGHENNIEHTNTPVTNPENFYSNIPSNAIIGANIFTNEEEPISERNTNTLNSSSIYGTESEHNTCITEERNGKITNNIERDITNFQDEDILPQISPQPLPMQREKEIENLMDMKIQFPFQDNGSNINSSSFLYNSVTRREELCKALAVVLVTISRKAGASVVNDLIKILCDEELHIPDVRRNIKNIKMCEKIVSTLVKENMKSSGFNEEAVSDNKGNICTLYKRSIKDVIKNQLSQVDRSKIYISPKEATTSLDETDAAIEIHSHPMSCEIGVRGSSIIFEEVNQSKDEDVIWFSENSMHPSAPLLLQIYSDKSQTSLKSSNFQFYPVHVIPLNLQQRERNNAIVHGRTIVGYLPVTFSCESEIFAFENDLQRFNLSSGICRQDRIGLLHKCLQTITNEITEYSLKGFLISTKDNNFLNMHPALASYVADLPEAKDLLSVMHGNRSMRNCHRCLCRSSDFPLIQETNPRTLSQMNHVVEKFESLIERASIQKKHSSVRAKSLRETAEKLLQKFSIGSEPPALSTLPFVGTSSFDPYQIFSFEPLHFLHLGVTKMILSCLHLRVRSLSTRPTIVFGKMNNFLREVHRIYKCQDLNVDFGCSGKPSTYNGLFLSDGLVGMLEAKDYKRIEKVLPFLGCICDRALDEVRTAPITNIFTLYTTFIRQLYREGEENYWTKGEVHKFNENIRKFKDLSRSAFGSYQKSNMGTMKFHLLDHLIQDLYRMGSISFCCAGLFEYTHLHFKSSYRSTSKRTNEALGSTIRRREEEMALAESGSINQKQSKKEKEGGRSSETTIPEHVKYSSKAAILAMKSDIPTTTISSMDISLCSLKSFIDDSENTDINSQDLKLLRMHSKNFEEGGMEILLAEINHVLQDEEMQHHDTITLGFHFTAYIPSIEVPDISDVVLHGQGSPHVHVLNRKKRFIQKVICARDYHNAKGLRQDSVMLRNGDCDSGDKICILFASLRSIVSLKVRSQKGHDIFNRQFVFVNFFDVVPHRDKPDEVLGCIRLRWERAHEGDAEDVVTDLKGNKRKKLDPGKWFGLTPIESIVGVLPVVPTDGFDPYDQFPTKSTNSSGFHCQLPWFDQYFHINRFYSEDSQNMYTAPYSYRE